MLLIHGEIIHSNMEEKYLDGLYEECVNTVKYGNAVPMERIIAACDILYHRAINGEYDDVVMPLLQMSNISYERFMAMARLFSAEELEYKCRMELGDWYGELPDLKNGIHRRRFPLGILFHIAAGNVDGLPAYSVLEGLLAGNINLLKLPSGDSGLSVRLLWELIQLEPGLRDYIYVFDVPSVDIRSLMKLAQIADGIVVWGGDEVVRTVRNMASPETKIIAWGHKLSFAYVTESVSNEDLYQLAMHICETNQVLCSSCQGIFVDTDDEMVLKKVGESFFNCLLKANQKFGKADIGMRGKNAIRLYTDELEEKDEYVLKKEGVSVVIKKDSELEISYLFRNIWIKPLKKEKICITLKKYKNHLQTCGLLCKKEERNELAELLAKAGVVRITGSHMSRMASGEAHDGVYPLREYSRIVEIDG